MRPPLPDPKRLPGTDSNMTLAPHRSTEVAARHKHFSDTTAHAPQPARIPILDLAPEIDALWDEIQAAMHQVVRSGHFILGPQVQAFEKEAAAYLGAAHAVG